MSDRCMVLDDIRTSERHSRVRRLARAERQVASTLRETRRMIEHAESMLAAMSEIRRMETR